MTGNHVALVTATFMAFMAILIIDGAQAGAPTLNKALSIPNEDRVDGSQPMVYAIEYNDPDGDVPVIVVSFAGTVDTITLVCSANNTDCTNEVDPDPNGWWEVGAGQEKLALDLVSVPGSEVIFYNFKATSGADDDEVCSPNPSCDTVSSGVRVNTLPVLSDDVTVNNGMPEDDYTVTVTYTDADNHPAKLVTATACDAEANCDTPFELSTIDSDFTDGAEYSAIFNTELGGTITVTVNAEDDYDLAESSQEGTFTVDTTTPWLKNIGSYAISGGTDDDFTFTVVYCVFDATGQGTPDVDVTIGAAKSDMIEGSANEVACKNGKDYSVTTKIAWAALEQAVAFSVLNDNGPGAPVNGASITINDAPSLSDGSAERDTDNFVLSVKAADINSDDGDIISVYALIEFDDTVERAMSCTDGDCSLTVAEAVIRDQRGGSRAVTFRAEDSHGTSSPSGDFGNSIDVSKTSSFVLTGPGDQLTAPGSNGYSFTIQNNGNSEDTFTISGSSLNDWVSGSSDSSVIVPYDSSNTFTIVMDVPHVAVGTTDSWSVDVTAGNDDTQTDSDSGTTTVDEAPGHTVSIADSAKSVNPGSTAKYYFTITNTGNADASFGYTSSGTPSLGDTGSLGMGESVTVAVDHTISSSAVANQEFVLTFSSGGKEQSATTTTNQVYGLDIARATDKPVSIKPGDSFDIKYTVTNTGNGPDSGSVSFNSAWFTSSDSSTFSALAAGATKDFIASFAVPSIAASGDTTSASASATGTGSSASSADYGLSVSLGSRSVSLSSDTDSYIINKGSSTDGTVTVTNGGVEATFAVVSMSNSLSFTTSEINLGLGQSGDLTFTINAMSSGDFQFKIEDTIDGSSDTFTISVTAREFDTGLLTTETSDCGKKTPVVVTCVTDSNGGWDGTKYVNSGTWSTTMTVVDSNGLSGSHTFTTEIINSAPSLSEVSADDGTAGKSQTFIFDVPSDTDGEVTHLVIDFGDGNSFTFNSSELVGNTVSVKHTYESSGNFKVTATAYDNTGANTVQDTTISVGERTVKMDGSSYTYNLVALVGFFVLGMLLTATAFKMQQGEIVGDEEMNERDRQRLESVERRMESLAEREELLEVSAYDASKAATKLEEHISAFNGILIRAQEIAAEEKLKQLEAAEEAKVKEEEQMQLDLEDPDIEMVAERFHDALGRLVKARDELSKIEEQLSQILKMERDEQLEKLTSMTESYETTKRKIDALESAADARDAAAVESNIMNMLSAAASGGSATDFGGDFSDFGDSDDDEYEVEIYEEEDGSFYYIDPDTGEEVPCDEDGNAL